MDTYACITNNVKEKAPYKIIPVRYQDLALIKDWRNEQMDILRTKTKLTTTDQDNYYKQVILKNYNSPKPSQLLFSFLLENKCIGYGGITNLCWFSKRAELSFLLDTKRGTSQETYSEDFIQFLTLIKKIAFDELKLHRLFTETYDIRPWHIKILEKAGFELEGRMRDHVLLNNKWTDSVIHGCIRRENV